LRQQRQKSEARSTFGHLEHIERVLRNGRQLRLINDTLEVSGMRLGRWLQPVPRCAGLINNCLEALEPLAAEATSGAQLRSRPDKVQTDPLRHSVTNLVSNAIRYTQDWLDQDDMRTASR